MFQTRSVSTPPHRTKVWGRLPPMAAAAPATQELAPAVAPAAPSPTKAGTPQKKLIAVHLRGLEPISKFPSPPTSVSTKPNPFASRSAKVPTTPEKKETIKSDVQSTLNLEETAKSPRKLRQIVESTLPTPDPSYKTLLNLHEAISMKGNNGSLEALRSLFESTHFKAENFKVEKPVTSDARQLLIELSHKNPDLLGLAALKSALLMPSVQKEQSEIEPPNHITELNKEESNINSAQDESIQDLPEPHPSLPCLSTLHHSAKKVGTKDLSGLAALFGASHKPLVSEGLSALFELSRLHPALEGLKILVTSINMQPSPSIEQTQNQGVPEYLQTLFNSVNIQPEKMSIQEPKAFPTLNLMSTLLPGETPTGLNLVLSLTKPKYPCLSLLAAAVKCS